MQNMEERIWTPHSERPVEIVVRREPPFFAQLHLTRLVDRRLRRVLDFIHEHLAGDLSLPELAKIANVSPSHFKLLFKASIGVPVHQYIIHRRVEYAMDLILRGKIPLSEIALQAGFANQSHMASSMRRIAGITPGMLKRGKIKLG